MREYIGTFAPMPIVLIDLACLLAENPKTRGFARVFRLVVMDLVRYTDWKYCDAVVSNEGIRKRAGVSASGVKASIHLLTKMEVLRRTKPSPERRRHLQMVLRGGFSEQKRYLVWNPESEWLIPRFDTAFRDIEEIWARHRGKRGTAGRSET
jgi:hypothetical protein